MVTRLENDIFDIMVEPSDWRYSAAIVGLSRYFEDRDKMEDEDYEVDEDCIKFAVILLRKRNFYYLQRVIMERNFHMFR